jgi:tetratricopeptide (TPR) repeat protein
MRQVRISRVLLAAALLSGGAAIRASADEPARPRAAGIVDQIRKADYEGDRAALKRLYEDLAPFKEDPAIASRVLYWRGFALWRRAINGFNEKFDPKEQEDDLTRAIGEFDSAAAKDPKFADAEIGKLSCLGLIGYLHMKEPGAFQKLMPQIRALVTEIKVLDPDNPRFVWVHGQNVWNIPPERGGGQDKAIEMYKTSLESVRKKPAPTDPLEPSWAEPELLMSLAYSYAYKTQPDLDTAEKYATEALKVVPYWHYVRDILLPQIHEMKAKKG